MQQLGPRFEERARRSLVILTSVFAWLIWLLVAAMIVFFIFRIAMFYIGMLNDVASGNLDALGCPVISPFSGSSPIRLSASPFD